MLSKHLVYSIFLEIRNEIFKYIVEEPLQHSPKYLPAHSAPAHPSPTNKLEPRILSWRIAAYYLRPLMETCQQLRAEFKGYVSSKYEFIVDLRYMNKICEYWILGGGVHNEPGKAYGNFAIDVSHPRTKDLDIATMLRTYLAVYAAEQKLHFRFYTTSRLDQYRNTVYYHGYAAMLNRLFSNTYDNEEDKVKWRTFISDHVFSVFPRHFRFGQTTLEFIVDQQWYDAAAQSAKEEDIELDGTPGGLTSETWDLVKCKDTVDFWHGLMGFNVHWAYSSVTIRPVRG